MYEPTDEQIEALARARFHADFGTDASWPIQSPQVHARYAKKVRHELAAPYIQSIIRAAMEKAWDQCWESEFFAPGDHNPYREAADV